MTYIELSAWDVAAVSGFVLLNGLLSLWLSLGIDSSWSPPCAWWRSSRRSAPS